MRGIMPRQMTPLMNRIITEEKSHLALLSDIKKRVAEIS
jgi:hypothetical protein